MASDSENSLARARMELGASLVDGGFRALALTASLNPRTWPTTYGVQRVRNVRYASSRLADHLLDIYLPPDGAPKRPALVYYHGGGFRILSKDSHYLMGISFARKGFVTIVPNYRRAPEHPFPAAHEDAFDAYAWALANAESLGALPGPVVVAGESAGGNLAASVVAAACWERPEAFARRAFDAPVPAAAVTMCPYLEISDPDRFRRRREMPRWLYDRVREVSVAYLGHDGPATPQTELANPLLLFESADEPDRKLPPFCLSAGTRDPILDDTRRMAAALQARGTHADLEIFKGEVHAFQAFVWRTNARAAWKQTFRFLDEVLT